MTTDGEKQSGPPKTAEERLSALDTVLAHYEKNLGLRENVPPHEADKFLHLEREELRSLTVEECNEGYYILLRYAAYIQRELNKEKSHTTWAESTLNMTTIEDCEQYKTKTYTSYEERKLLAIRNNAFAQKVEHIRMLSQARIDRLNYVASDIKQTAGALLEIKRTKEKSSG